MTPELKVGLFFVIILGAAVTFTVIVRPDWQRQGEFAVSFPKVSRLKSGDPVNYNGVRVGKVTAVTPVVGADGVPVVKVAFNIETQFRKEVRIDAGTHWRITQGVLGGASLDVTAISGASITPELVAKAQGETPTSLDEAVESVRSLIEENRDSVRQALITLREGLGSFGSMSEELKAVVVENRPGIKTTIDNVGVAAKNVGDAAVTINSTVQENRDDLRAGIANIRSLTARLDKVIADNEQAVKDAIANVGRAGGEIADTVAENRKSLRETMESLARAAPKFERLGDNLDVITSQIAAGKGTIGKLVMEDTLHTKTVAVLDSAQTRLDEIKPFTQGVSQLHFYGGVEGGSNLDSGVMNYGAYLRIEPKPWKYYEAGISYRTAPDDLNNERKEDPDKLNVDFRLLLGWRFFADDDHQRYHLDLAAGLIETRLGARAMLPIVGDVWTTAIARQAQDNREPDDRRFEDGPIQTRVTLDWNIWRRVWVSVGGDDLGGNPGFYAGLRGEILDDDLRNLTTASALKP